MSNFICEGFDGNKYWPFLLLKRSERMATVVECDCEGKPLVNAMPKTRKIQFLGEKPSIQYHRECSVEIETPFGGQM